eukprot:2257298-Amphidinium_carterae.1
MSGSETLRWHVLRIMISLGYVDTKYQRLSDSIRELFPKWEGLLRLFGLDVATHSKRSEKSHKCAKEEELTDDVMKQHWLSTEGVVTMLVWASTARRGAMPKQQSRSVFLAFLSGTVALELVPILKTLGPELLDCDCGGTGSCQRQARFLQESARLRAGADEHEYILEQLVLCSELVGCPIVQDYICNFLKQLGSHISERIDLWGQNRWHTSDQATLMGNKRKRNVDREVKDLLQSDVVEGKRRNLNTALEGVMDGKDTRTRKVMRTECKERKESALEAFGTVTHRTLSVALDCARLGKPAVECQFTVVVDPSSSMAALCPPEVTER